MTKKLKKMVALYFAIVLCMLGIILYEVVKVDPYMHYHKPKTDSYFYELNNERSQNDGISKQLDYDAIITGTSMTQNFKTSELDKLFGTNSIKMSFSGASYKEVNEAEERALGYNPNVKMVVRSIDMTLILYDKDYMRTDLGEYPDYLYDNNIFNDVKYVFNRDVIFSRVYKMMKENDAENFKTGMTSFDRYSNWMGSKYTFGRKSVYSTEVKATESKHDVQMSDEEREMIKATIRQNITSLTEEHKNVEFYYFIPPYSIARWQNYADKGMIHKYIEAEEILIEEVLKCSNIKLFSFNNETEMTTDLNNYKDELHYGSWVNSYILSQMKSGEGLLTKDNYKDYLREELEFYSNYDYSKINEQQDYDNDYYAAALMNQKITGVEPLDLMELAGKEDIAGAEIVEKIYDGANGIECKGTLNRNKDAKESVSEYLYTNEYAGMSINVDVSKYSYLVFYGKNINKNGQPTVYIYDKNGKNLGGIEESYRDLSGKWKQYLIDVSELKGNVTIIFNGAYTDSTGDPESTYIFGDIKLY